MKTVAIIPSRFDSNRLPGKAMRPMAGVPMLGRLLERVMKAPSLDEVVVATTTLPSDDKIVALAERYGARFFRGAERDVLGRIVGAARDAKADVVVEILGDSPLVHRELIDDVVAFRAAKEVDFACSYTKTVRLPEHGTGYREFPVGIWVECFPTEVMAQTERDRSDVYAREHSTTSMYKHPELFRLDYLEATGKWAEANVPELFLAVNFQEHYDLVSAVFERLYPEDPDFGVLEAVRVAKQLAAEGG